MGCLYTLHWIDTGIIIQSGDVPNPKLYPPVPKGAIILEGVDADPEHERVENGKVVPWNRPLEQEELLSVIERTRAKKLEAGFIYDFKDRRGKHRIGTTVSDEIGWSKVTTLAYAYISAGMPEAQLSLETDTGSVQIFAREWPLILIQKGTFEQKIYAISFELQKRKPIPQDVDDPKYWG